MPLLCPQQCGTSGEVVKILGEGGRSWGVVPELQGGGGVPFHRAWPLSDTGVRDFLYTYSTCKKYSARPGAGGLKGQGLHKVIFSVAGRALHDLGGSQCWKTIPHGYLMTLNPSLHIFSMCH